MYVCVHKDQIADLQNRQDPFTARNFFFTANATISIPCGNTTFTLEEYQKLGYDIGSTVDKLPSNSEVISWGKQLLGP